MSECIYDRVDREILRDYLDMKGTWHPTYEIDGPTQADLQDEE